MQKVKAIGLAGCSTVERCKKGYKYTYGEPLVTISTDCMTPNDILGLFPYIMAIVANYRIRPYIIVVVNANPPSLNSTQMCAFCFLKDDHQLMYYLHSYILDDYLQRDDTYPMMDKDRKNLLLISNTGKRMAKIRIQ